MSTLTPNLGLFKYDVTNDSQTAFSITNALNNNWDKIDTAWTNIDALPDQTDKAGYLLTTNGNEASWGETTEVYSIIETYKLGYSWYRVWSDGWCEQGGIIEVSAAAYIPITLMKTYENPYYNLFVSGPLSTVSQGSTANMGAVRLKATNSFEVYCPYGGYFHSWTTAGYMGT